MTQYSFQTPYTAIIHGVTPGNSDIPPKILEDIMEYSFLLPHKSFYCCIDISPSTVPHRVTPDNLLT